MNSHASHLQWIDSQQDRMRLLVERWAGINSGSQNIPGLARMAEDLKQEFAVLDGQISDVSLPAHLGIGPDGLPIDVAFGRAISIRKRPESPLRVFLGIHFDTVYGIDHPFQGVQRIAHNALRGPGVADAKGGLAVLLLALEALERSPVAKDIGWEILLNPDEELGSPGSAGLLADAARRNHLGLLFEPSLPDGKLVSQRKGSGNFSVVIRGRSAHVGRDFHMGRNAVHAAAQLAVALNALNHGMPGVTVNVGRIDGGGPSNVVPDLAICRFNVRVPTPEDQSRVLDAINRAVEPINQLDGISAVLHGSFLSPPKPCDKPMLALLNAVAACGHELNLDIAWQPSGGVCDGNKLAAAGLTVVDTLGVRGGNLHSDQEYLLIDSLWERAKLSALLLMKLAAGEIRWERK